MLRFDDSWQDQWFNALPVLEEYGYHAAFLAITGGLNSNSYPANSNDSLQYMSWNEFQWLYNDGYEIADHSMTHPDLNQMSRAELYTEVVASKQLLASHGINNVPAFALPYGDAWNNQTVMSYILNNGFIHVYSAYDSPAISQYSQANTIWYPIDLADNDLSLSQFEQLANQASSSAVVGFEFHHVFSNSNDVNSSQPYSISLDLFKQEMAWLNSSGFTVILPEDLPGYYNVPPPPPMPSTTTQSTSTTRTSATSTTFHTSTGITSSAMTSPTTSSTTQSKTATYITSTMSTSSSISTTSIFSTSKSSSSSSSFVSSYTSSSASTSTFNFISISVTSAYEKPPSTTTTSQTSGLNSSSLPVFFQPTFLAIAVAAMGLIFVSQRVIRARQYKKEA